MNFQINQTNRYRVIGGWKLGYILGGLVFLAALQPYKWLVCIKIYRPFSLVIKTKVVQNVKRMSDRQIKRQTDRQENV